MYSTQIAPYNAKLPETSMFFKEESICVALTIPPQHPRVLRLLDACVYPEIDSYKMLETQVGRSYEGQNLTGVQLSVDVGLKQKITYVADNRQQSVHVANFATIETVFIILPVQINHTSVCDLVNSQLLTVSPYIEAVDARIIDCATIQNSMLMLVDAKLHPQQKGER